MGHHAIQSPARSDDAIKMWFWIAAGVIVLFGSMWSCGAYVLGGSEAYECEQRVENLERDAAYSAGVRGESGGWRGAIERNDAAEAMKAEICG